MLNGFLPAIFVGIVLGFLTGLGTGGGSLLILWMTLVLDMEPSQARLINLMFFLPAALISSVLRWFRGGIPLKKIWPAALGGCLAAVAFSIGCRQMDTENLKRLFGLLLIFIGLREVFYRPRKPR